MGGYGSNRWGGKRVRATTGNSLGLDIATLKPYLGGGEWGLQWKWKRGDRDAGSVGLRVNRERIMLQYMVTHGGGEPHAVYDEIGVVRTPCGYGGERAWFLCPRCRARRRVLYLAPSTMHFRCRVCHDLAYSTQQADKDTRLYLRERTLQRRLGGKNDEYGPGQMPPKPKGMHWRTYMRLCNEIHRRELDRLRLLSVECDKLFARFEKLRA